MLVYCKCHIGHKIDRDTAFKVIVNNKNEYYCTEKDYLKIKEDKDTRKYLILKINDVFGYIITNTALSKELSELSKVYSYTKINSYVTDNMNELQKFMSKSFNNEYGKIRYFSTILKNNLKDYIVSTPVAVKQSDAEIIGVRYKSKTRKKSMDEYMDEVE